MSFIFNLRRLLFWMVLGVFTANLSAQNVLVTRNKTSSGIRAGFNGSLIYPGFRGGLEYPFKRIEFTRYRGKRAPRQRVKDRFLTAEFGFYHHPTFHDNYYLLFGYLLRRNKPNRIYWEFAPALGYSRTFLGGETYRVNHLAGTVTRVQRPGYHYAMLSLGGGLGKAFTSRISGFSRLSMLIMAPSNNIIYFRPTLEIGVVLKPKHFLIGEPLIVSRIKGK